MAGWILNASESHLRLRLIGAIVSVIMVENQSPFKVDSVPQRVPMRALQICLRIDCFSITGLKPLAECMDPSDQAAVRRENTAAPRDPEPFAQFANKHLC